jgi:hypothetical protein
MKNAMARFSLPLFTYERRIFKKVLGFIKVTGFALQRIPYFYHLDDSLVIEKAVLIIYDERKKIHRKADS